MSIQAIEKTFQERVHNKLQLFEEGDNRFRVFTPFVFDDGDHFAVVLKKENDHWVLSDEGSTYMHLTLKIDEKDLFDPDGTRAKLILRTLSSFNVVDREGELIATVEDNEYGDALYNLIQALIKISDLTYLSRERVVSTFYEDFERLITETVPNNRYHFNWYDNELDTKRLYKVDCRINGMPKPLFVYALSNEERLTNATISIYKFKDWGLSFQPIAIFEDTEDISKKALDRFTEVCDRQYINIKGNRNKIAQSIREMIGVN